MQARDPVRLNQPIELQVVDGPYAGRYRSRIEESTPRHLGVAVPFYQGSRLWLPRGTRVHLSLLLTRGGSAGRYEAETEVVGWRELDPVPVLVLLAPRWRKLQLRSFVRVDWVLPVQYRRLPAQDAPEQEPPPWQQAETRDLSGGGLLLVTREPLVQGDRLELVIPLPGAVPIGAVAEAVRVKPLVAGLETDRAGLRAVGVQFLEIDEADRDRLVRAVLLRQAEMRRKGLI